MLILSQVLCKAWDKTQSLCQAFTLGGCGGTDDRIISVECECCGVGSLEEEGHGSHARLPRGGDISADPEGQKGLKKEKRRYGCSRER